MNKYFSKITINCSSAQAAETFIWNVSQDQNFKSKTKFLLTGNQRRDLKLLRKEANRPNESKLNFKAFLITLLIAELLLLAIIFITGSHFISFNIIPITLGLLVLTIAAAIPVLGLYSSSSSTHSLKKIQLYCEDSWIKPLRQLAMKY